MLAVINLRLFVMRWVLSWTWLLDELNLPIMSNSAKHASKKQKHQSHRKTRTSIETKLAIRLPRFTFKDKISTKCILSNTDEIYMKLLHTNTNIEITYVYFDFVFISLDVDVLNSLPAIDCI